MSPNVKLQTTIPNSNIVVDYWDVKPSNGHDPSIRFMTSLNHHSVRAIAHMRKANYLIYTTLFNRWYLHQFYQISEDRIMVLDHNETMEIFDSDRNEKFKVSAIQSNYCSGSSMFLFQGSFGNVLYTGFFRLSSSSEVLSCAELREVVEQNRLDVAYVDNSYAAEHCNFPSRAEMMRNIIDFTRSCSNYKILISSNLWGREEVLLAVASELDEKVDVGPQRYSTFEKLGVADFFTCQSKETRIRVLDNLLTLNECLKMLKQDKSCVIILMTALYKYRLKKMPLRSKYPRLFIIPYSGHCNHNELKNFLSTIRPHTILPVILPRPDQPCSIIPKSIYDLCGEVNKPSSSVDEKECRKYIEKSDPSVVIPRLQVSPLRLKRINGSYCPASETTPVARRSLRSRVVTSSCGCKDDKSDLKVPSEVSTKTVNTSRLLRSSTRLSSSSTLAVKEDQNLRKSKSKTNALLQLPSSSNASLIPANIEVTEKERILEKSIKVSVDQNVNRSFNDGRHSAAPSPISHAGPQSANVSAVDEKQNTRKSTSKESVEEHANIVEPVLPLSPKACFSKGHPTGDENEQCVVYSSNNLVVEEVPNLNDVVTPPRETESEEPLSSDEMSAENIPEFSFPNNLEEREVPDLSEAVTPPLRSTEKKKSLGKNKMDVANVPELEDRHRTTTSSLDNCFIREESRNVLLDLASVHVDRNEEDIIDEMPLTLRLQTADIRDIREDCRNMLLGSKFPHIFQREEQVEEMPLAPSLENYVIEEFIVEETMPSTGDISPNREANLPSSKHSNEEAMETDSAEVVDTREMISTCEVVSDTRGIESTTPSEQPHNSENVSPVRTSKRSLDTAIEVTIFELDEVSGRANVTDLESKKTTPLEGSSNSQSAEDDCILEESSYPVNNTSHLLVRSSPGGRLRDSVDADLSDSDDCVVVGEFIRGVDTPVHVPSDHVSKRLKLNPIYRPRRNDRYVNAIFFHYMKSRPQEMNYFAFDHYNILSQNNIFSHSAYKKM